jgi:hypothetical protein
MPTLQHSALVEMFREQPALAPRFLADLFRLDVPPHAVAAVVESAIDQILPVELRADLVLELQDAEGTAVLAVVVEVQRHEDPDKKRSWPAYVSLVRARKQCGTVVLVVAPDARVAAWAAEDIDLGLGRGWVSPVVLGPETVPRVTDAAVAAQEVELSVLSALAHGNGADGLPVLEAALRGLGRLDQEHAMVYFQIIWDVLRTPVRQALEALVMERQNRVNVDELPVSRHFFELGVRKGLREGELKGLRDVLLRLIARVGIPVGEGDRARIQACEDAATLDRWVENVLGAKTLGDILS